MTTGPDCGFDLARNSPECPDAPYVAVRHRLGPKNVPDIHRQGRAAKATRSLRCLRSSPAPLGHGPFHVCPAILPFGGEVVVGEAEKAQVIRLRAAAFASRLAMIML